ncbi:hypothetical protein FOG50_02911 [Hanseniaspora uvarum]|nr:hypothetical protein FOG50_02911 [Hanseniaspora uvarum]
MVKLGYLSAYYMPLISSSRYNIVLMTVFITSVLYSTFFLSSNFLPSTFTEDKKHIFIPNEQDYFRTCLLGIFSPMFFNIIKNILLKFPIRHSALKVITHIFIESCVYDWFLFLIIFFLAYPQIETNSYANDYNEVDEVQRNVFHIIPKQSYILAICWSLSECIISVLENMSIYQEVLSPEILAKEELGISKPVSLNIFHSIFITVKSLIIKFVNTFIINTFKFIGLNCYKAFKGIVCLFNKKKNLEFEEEETAKNEKIKFNLLKQLDVSKCSEALQKAMMRQKSMQYQTSDTYKNTTQPKLTKQQSNNSFINKQNIGEFQQNIANIDPQDDNDLISNQLNMDGDKNLEEVVLINFKEETMQFAKINQDDLNYGSIKKIQINNSSTSRNGNMNILSNNNNLSPGSGNSKFAINSEVSFKNKKVEFIMSVLKMKGKPRPGNLFTNKNIWQLKKEAETKKYNYLEQQKKEKLYKYNEKLMAFQQQKQLLSKSESFMNQSDFINGTNGNLQAIQSSQYKGLEQAEQNLNDELINIKNYYQQQFDSIKEAVDYYNEKSKKFQAILREKKSSSKNSSSNESDERTVNMNNDNSFELVYNFYRIDKVGLFFRELRNMFFILMSNITTLIGEVLIFSIYFIYVPGHNKLFTPCVNYFGDKSFMFFIVAVLLPYTLINFMFQFTLFFWSKLRQEYYFSNRINEFELLWGIDDEIMNQINSNRHFQNMDISMNNRMIENGYVSSQTVYGNDLLNGDYYGNSNNNGNVLSTTNSRSYNPFKWLFNAFRRHRQAGSGDVDKNYDYYYPLDRSKNKLVHGIDAISSSKGRLSGGNNGNKVFNNLLNYDGLSGPKGGSEDGSSDLAQHMNSNDYSASNYSNQSVDYYQAVINNLNPNIDPLSTAGNINNAFSGLNDDANRGIASVDVNNSRRNMSILSTHELKMLNNASLISSNLTFKEIFLIVMYRIRQVVIKWRLISENSTVTISLLVLFGIVSFCFGIILTVTDIFLYFDHE